MMIELEREIPFKKRILELILAIGGILGMIISTLPLYSSEDLWKQLIFWSGIVLWGTMIVYAIYVLLTRKIGIQIYAEGIINNSIYPIKGKPLYWEEISGIDSLNNKEKNYIVLRLKDEDQYLAKYEKNRDKKTLQRLIKDFGSPAIIKEDQLDTDFIALYKDLKSKIMPE